MKHFKSLTFPIVNRHPIPTLLRCKNKTRKFTIASIASCDNLPLDVIDGK